MVWRLTIGTRTTPRKRKAIYKAFQGRIDATSWEYIKEKYEAALFWPLRRIFPSQFSDTTVKDFINDCLEDAFSKEIAKYNDKKPFRTFLSRIIIAPRFRDFMREHEGKAVTAANLNEISSKIETGTTEELGVQLTRDALKLLKKKDATSYEIVCQRIFESKKFTDMAVELGISAVVVRQKYHRALKKKLPQIFHGILRTNKHLDKDTPWDKKYLAILKSFLKNCYGQ